MVQFGSSAAAVLHSPGLDAISQELPYFHAVSGLFGGWFPGRDVLHEGGYGARLPLSYTYFWLWTEPVLLLLQIAVALEVHARMWTEHSALVRPAKPLLFFALIIALVFAAIPLKAELSRFSAIQLRAIMQFEFLAKRYISTVLALFLVFSAALFLIAIRNGSRSSLFRHEGMLAAYFGIYAIAVFSVDMGWAMPTLVNNYLASALTLCFVVWMSVFKPREELLET